MTENVQPPPAADAKPYSWEDVAATAHDWHPALRQHVGRLLDIHGVERPASMGVVQSETDNASPQPARPAEVIAPEVAEGRKSSPEERTEAFTFGIQTLYKLTADPKLHARCEEAGIDPFEDTDTPEYWKTLADYSQERIDFIRERSGNSMRVRALELMAATPAYLLEQAAINQGARADLQERRESLRLISRYHNLIIDFVETYPDAKASELTLSLLDAANLAIQTKLLRQSAAYDIRQRIRGVQHELAFGDILRQSGRSFRRATAREDLRGFDYVLDEDTDSPLRVDVKNNLREVETHGEQTPVAQNDKGVFVAYSLITDAELRDGFTIPPALAHQKAQAFLHYLDIAAQPRALEGSGA